MRDRRASQIKQVFALSQVAGAIPLPLFPSEAGTPILPRNLVRQFKELLTKAGLPDTIRFHDLRHFAATTLLWNGADISTTQAVLGHTDASVTLNFYAHALPSRIRIMVNDVVNAAFGVKEDAEDSITKPTAQ